MKVGIGYDIHRLVEGRALILGGVSIPSSLGLEGHSDADVLLHAVCDALLGAAGKGDIGMHFPPDDDRFLNISSLILLEKVNTMISGTYSINNVDCTVVAERPKLSPYIELMQANIAECLGLDAANVNVKATTSEGLGPVGEGIAIAAYALASIEPLNKNSVVSESTN